MLVCMEKWFDLVKEKLAGWLTGFIRLLPNLVLAIIIFGFAVIGGLVFGGFRILLRKLFPNRFADPTEDREFIRLNIE